MSQVAGFSVLSPADRQNDPTYVRVDDFLRMVNSQNLKDSKVIAAFYKNSGFSRSYKVYYKASSKTYEGYVTYDIFRDRLYIINFGTIGYSLI